MCEDEDTFSFSEDQLRVEWFSGTGKGGQHRNRHQNSCRMVHERSGITATAQCRSRQDSYKKALDEIRRRVYNQHNEHCQSEQAVLRKDKVGSGMRADKIRTYRFQDNVVTDHLTGRKSSCGLVMNGGFELLW